MEENLSLHAAVDVPLEDLDWDLWKRTRPKKMNSSKLRLPKRYEHVLNFSSLMVLDVIRGYRKYQMMRDWNWGPALKKNPKRRFQ